MNRKQWDFFFGVVLPLVMLTYLAICVVGAVIYVHTHT